LAVCNFAECSKLIAVVQVKKNNIKKIKVKINKEKPKEGWRYEDIKLEINVYEKKFLQVNYFVLTIVIILLF